MGYYKQVDGVRVDAELYELAPEQLTLRSVVELLNRVIDGDRYTAIEYATLELLARRPGTPAGRAWLRGFLKAYNPGDWKKSKPKAAKKVTKKTSKKTAAKTSAKKKTAKKGAKKKTPAKKAAKKKTAKKQGARRGSKAVKKKVTKKKVTKKRAKKTAKQTKIPGT